MSKIESGILNLESGTKILLIFITMAFFAASCNQNTSQPVIVKSPVRNIVTIGTHEINVEIANTNTLREQGLSGRESLGENDGMLFVFDMPGKYSFWMKDMNFSLDFIWIRDNKIVEITQDVPNQPDAPLSSLKLYTPESSIDSVLEVTAGFVSKNNLQVGQSLNLTTK